MTTFRCYDHDETSRKTRYLGSADDQSEAVEVLRDNLDTETIDGQHRYTYSVAECVGGQEIKRSHYTVSQIR